MSALHSSSWCHLETSGNKDMKFCKTGAVTNTKKHRCIKVQWFFLKGRFNCYFFHFKPPKEEHEAMSDNGVWPATQPQPPLLLGLSCFGNNAALCICYASFHIDEDGFTLELVAIHTLKGTFCICMRRQGAWLNSSIWRPSSFAQVWVSGWVGKLGGLSALSFPFKRLNWINWITKIHMRKYLAQFQEGSVLRWWSTSHSIYSPASWEQIFPSSQYAKHAWLQELFRSNL